ncbi:right-handed parallel beta-helix repeat-containing protein [Agrobacterium tumefaciens]|uniref:right-handed parallel beta-helix repeat-containing protein n=1 Tax=Agrobacterium tumefaciens TaxID=358 RepID=UPI0015736DEA|nr:fructotransferase [Agrobacterium tumefaciens]
MPGPHSSTYDVTKFHGSVPASQDIGAVINEIIADIKAHQTSQTAKPGGDIFIPVGDYDLLTQIVIDISYLTIRGEGHGFTSLSIRDNTPDTTNWRETVAGGSHVKIKLTGAPAIITRRNGAEPRLASIVFRDFCLDGLHFDGDGNSYINDKTGIYVEGDCDAFVFRGMGFVYLERAIVVEGADATTVDGNFIAECGSCVELLLASQSCKVTNNLIGAGYNGKSIAATAADGLLIAANNVFPRGGSSIELTNSARCSVTANRFAGFYPGMIRLLGTNETLLAANLIRRQNETYPPFQSYNNGLAETYGIIHIQGDSNKISNNHFPVDPQGYTADDGPVVVINAESGIFNWISDNSFVLAAIPDLEYVAVRLGPAVTESKVIYSGSSAQIFDLGTLNAIVPNP